MQQEVSHVSSVVVQVVPDEDADGSFLEQEGWEDRLAAYQRDEFGFVGVRAVATVFIRLGEVWVSQEIVSPGLWGIESDSGEDYFAEVGREETATLGEMLAELGLELPS